MSLIQVLAVSSAVVALAYLAALTVAIVTLALRVGERREGPGDDSHAFSASRFTLPVSVVVPVTAAKWPDASPTIAAVLGLNYPNLEVIVVADDLPQGESASFKTQWRLEAREIFFRASLATAPIRMMYRSVLDPRLIVVRKTPAPAADALNCGVNLARFPYVCVVEPGIRFAPDALLRVMTAVMRDPAHVVGVTSHVEIVGGTFQWLRSVRSVMASHATSRLVQGSLGPRDAVVVWRREAVEQAGGFSTEAADAHLDMMVRLQTAAASPSGEFVRTAEVFGHRQSRSFVDDVRQTRRRWRAAWQVISTLRAAGSRIRPTLAYIVMSEVLTPCAQAWVIGATAFCAVSGWLPWTDVAVALSLLALGHAIVNAAAQLVRGAVSPAPEAPAGTAA